MTRTARARAYRSVIATGLITTGLVAAATSPVLAAAPRSTPASHGTALQRLVREHGRGELHATAAGPVVRPNVQGLLSTRDQRSRHAAPPSSFSLRRWAVPVGDQRAVNSCVAWAVGYAMLGWYAAYAGRFREYAPMYVYSQDHRNGDGGSTVEDAYAILAKQGIALQSAYAQGDEDYRTKPTRSETARARAARTTAPHWLYSTSGTGARPGAAARTAIETAIAHRHPVAISIPIYAPFYLLTPKHAVLHASRISKHAQVYGGHEVLVVGYDRTGVVVQNQWGTGWGDHGYATLDWAFVERYSVDASWIEGFVADLPAQKPAEPTQVQLQVSSPDANGASSGFLVWRGTAAYDDAVRHPVTGYHVRLTGSDSSSRSWQQQPQPEGTASVLPVDGLRTGVTYTVRLVAENAVGSGAAFVHRFQADAASDVGPIAAPDEPSPAMPAGERVPAMRPDTPAGFTGTVWYEQGSSRPTRVVLRWAKPASSGHSPVAAYRVRAVGKHGKRTAYAHTFSVAATHRSRTLRFTGAHHLKHGLSYVFSVSVRNRAGFWSPATSSSAERL